MALEQFNDEPWPKEGRTLGEIIERLVGPELWVYLLDWTGDRLSAGRRGPRQIFHFYIAHNLGPRFQAPSDHPYRRAVDACFPFLDDWNLGAIVAKAKVGGQFEPMTDISPPGAGYTLIIYSLFRSIIVDSTTYHLDHPKRFYDVRFFLPKQAAEQITGPLSSVETENTSPDPFKTGAAGRPTAKDIVLAEAERQIRDREVVPKQGGLTAFSESLETWWKQKRHTYKPAGPPMSASSIRNCGVRDLWNRALKGV